MLEARATHPNETLANLYAPDRMPITLRKAHKALDHAVDRLYRHKPFASDNERTEYLFALYEENLINRKIKEKEKRTKKAKIKRTKKRV